VSADAVRAAPGDRAVKSERVLSFAAIAFCGVLPVIVLCLVFASTISDGTEAIDFGQFYRGGEAILAGRQLYPPKDALLTASAHPYPYVYPPLPALLVAPLTVVPLEVLRVAFMAVLVLVVFAILRLLGVRDWRCYGIALLWPPVIAAIQTGNPTLWFALAAALAWRYRDRVGAASAAVGTTLAVKFVLWPLLVWLAATRRLASAAWAVLIGLALLIVPWAVIGFEGFGGYPGLLRRLERTVGGDSYTLANLARDLGLPSAVAHGLWLAVGLGVLVACALAGRSGDDRSAFVLAIAASLALSPLVWLHYFALMIVAVAVARPRLGIVWALPLAMFVGTGNGRPTGGQLAVTLAAAGLTFAFALRETRGSRLALSERQLPAAAPSVS
jgi:alpha-1,2-mannosyltransferase